MHEFTILVLFAPMIAAATLLGVFFLPAFRLVDVQGFPEPLHRSLVRELRRAGHVVSAGPRHLSVRIGPVSAVHIRYKETVEGTQLRYRPDATPSGWTLVLALIFLGAYGITAFAALVLVMYVAYRASEFASEVVAPIASRVATPDAPRPGPDALLVEGLAEAYRIATDARDAERSRYGDRELLAALAALAVWTGTFFALLLLGAPFWDAVAWSTVPALAVLLVAGVLVWRSSRPRRREYRAWSARLREAWERASGSPPEAVAEGYAILEEASPHVPAWLSTARRAGFLRDPHAYVVPVALGFWGYWLLWASVWFLPDLGPVPLAFGMGSAGVGMLGAAVALHRRWVRGQIAEERRFSEDWARRFESIRAAVHTVGRDR